MRAALLWVEAAAAIATVAAVAIGLLNHFAADADKPVPGEGKRVVAFRQVANRICTENRQNLTRALADGRSRIERLGFVARGVGWDINDLESLTPPPTRFNSFLAEVAVRRHVRQEVLALQQALELGNPDRKARALASIAVLESQSRELSREAGLVRCMTVLPSASKLLR